jgi:hypothetical protein
VKAVILLLLAVTAHERDLCYADVVRLCSGSVSGGLNEVKTCLESHGDQVSADCRAVLRRHKRK